MRPRIAGPTYQKSRIGSLLITSEATKIVKN
jgi:hypothetical protein